MTACDVCHAGWYAAARWGLGDLMECRLPSFPRSFSSFCLSIPPLTESRTTPTMMLGSSPLSSTRAPPFSLSHSLTHSLMPDRSLSISRRDVSHSPRARTDDTCGLPHKHHNSVTRSFRGQTNSRSFRKLIYYKDRLKMVPRLETRPRCQRRPGCNTQPRDHSSADCCAGFWRVTDNFHIPLALLTVAVLCPAPRFQFQTLMSAKR